MGKKADVIGKVFGRLTVVRYVEDRRATTKSGLSYIKKRVLCKCSCGNERITEVNSLLRGSTKSCGCFKAEKCGTIKKIKDGSAMVNRVMASYAVNARNRNIPFNLPKGFVSDLIQKDCVYCGSPPGNIKKPRPTDIALVYNGIDRKDNTKGYTEDNVVPCCKRCNYAKRDSTVEDFKVWVKNAYYKLYED